MELSNREGTEGVRDLGEDGKGKQENSEWSGGKEVEVWVQNRRIIREEKRKEVESSAKWQEIEEDIGSMCFNACAGWVALTN